MSNFVTLSVRGSILDVIISRTERVRYSNEAKSTETKPLVMILNWKNPLVSWFILFLPALKKH